MKKNQKNLKLLLSKKKINNRITELAKQISKDYKGKKPVFIGVLNGSFIFLADLIRNMSIDCEVAFINAKSYSGNKSTGKIEILDDMNLNIFEKDIIIVEDIIDSGRTIKFLYDRFWFSSKIFTYNQNKKTYGIYFKNR